MAEHIREIKVRVYVDTNKRTHDKEYTPEEDESLPDLLRRLADEYEERFS
jgi:hypothetical protein